MQRKKEIKKCDDEREDEKRDLFLCISGLADFVQQLRVETLVVRGSLGHGTLQGSDLLLGSAQTLLKPLDQAVLFGPLSLQRLHHSQQLLVAFTFKD